MTKTEVLQEIDLSVVPAKYSLMGVLFLNELLEGQSLVKVVTKDKGVHKKVYLRGNRLTRGSYHQLQFKYKLYNPYAKKSYVENRESVVKIEVADLELVDRIRRKYLARSFRSFNLDKYSSLAEAKEALLRFIESKMNQKREDDIMSKGYRKYMDNHVLDYLIKNKVPVKFYYTTGDEEILSLQMYDTYQYLAKNDEKGTTNFINKGNVVKIEIMGDLEKIFKD